MRHDIIYSLQSLNMIVECDKKLTICVDWNIVDAHVEKKKSSNHIPIEQDCIQYIGFSRKPGSFGSNGQFDKTEF